MTDRLKTYVDVAVDYASGKAEAIIARCTVASGSQIRFSESAIDISKSWESLKLELFFVLQGSQIGITQRAISNEEDVRKTVDDTLAFSKHLPDSMFFAGLETEVSQYDEILGCFDAKYDDFIETAPGVVNSTIDAAVSEGAKRVAGALKFSKEQSFFRSSYGPEGLSKRTTFDLNVRAFQAELDYSGQGLECGTIPSDSDKAMIAAGTQAGRLSKMAIGATQGEPGKYDLVISSTVAADVIGQIPGSANPFMVLIGMSPLGDRMGEQIGPEFLTINDDPRYLGGLNSGAFDFEGTPTRTLPIIENGILKSFVHNTTTGKMYDTESTGSSGLAEVSSGLLLLLSGSSNIVFEPGDQTMDELLETSKPTIYVTCNWYTRFQNYQTGDFSTIPRDAMFLVKNGELTPIKNLRISDNTLRMVKNISALGKERKQVFWWEVPVPTIVPAMKIDDCRMSAATL